MEFFDYTMDEHFDGAPVPVYLPRSEILQYFTARVPKHCDDFFARYFRFRHRVEHVVWDTTTQHFAVTVRDLVEDALREEYYDQCVWACGENGKQHVPQDLWQLFVDDGRFPGRGTQPVSVRVLFSYRPRMRCGGKITPKPYSSCTLRICASPTSGTTKQSPSYRRSGRKRISGVIWSTNFLSTAFA